MACSFRGQLLIAAPHLKDPNFYKSVVLIVEHGDQGAMGLVINRPSSVLVSHALSKHFELPDTGDLVFCGGPVEPLALFVLHNSEDLGGSDPSVISGLYIGSSGEVFEEVVRRGAESLPDLKFRVFSGCAGWAPEQLEGEIQRGDWYLHPACRETIYHEDPYLIYDLMLQKVHEAHRLLPDASGNPQWN